MAVTKLSLALMTPVFGECGYNTCSLFPCKKFLPFIFPVQHACFLLAGDHCHWACGLHVVAGHVDPRFSESARIILELSEFKIRYKSIYLE